MVASYDRPEQIAWDSLPERCVVKPARGTTNTGVYLLVRQGAGWRELAHGRELTSAEQRERKRMASVLQDAGSNYEIDLFQHLTGTAAKLLGTTDLANPSLRVIADHIRATAFLVADGVMPSNEGRGYVLRRIMRRAMRHGHKFGASPTFFAGLLPALAQVMGDAYPELREKQQFIHEVLVKEGEQFARTLATGMSLLEEAIATLGAGRPVDGAVVFRLHDTYGFPPDLTADVLRERGLTADMPGYEREMNAQRARARAASRRKTSESLPSLIEPKSSRNGHLSPRAQFAR